MSHAYEHLVGKAVGIYLVGIGIVGATVMTPEKGQDENDILAMTDDGMWHTVKYMDSYRADFANARVGE